MIEEDNLIGINAREAKKENLSCLRPCKRQGGERDLEVL
jgi:hypothetical protein